MRAPTLPSPYTAAMIAGGVGLLLLAVLVWRKGGIAGAASSIGSAAVDAAGGIASGAVGAAGAAVGLPTPDQTTTDAATARWIIDNHGHLAASQWAGALAYVRAVWMDAGTGTPPPAGSAMAAALPAPARSGPAAPGLPEWTPAVDVANGSFGDLSGRAWYPAGL